MRHPLWVAKTQFRAAHILEKTRWQMQSHCGIALKRCQTAIEPGGVVDCHPTLLWLGSQKSENLRFWPAGPRSAEPHCPGSADSERIILTGIKSWHLTQKQCSEPDGVHGTQDENVSKMAKNP